MSKQNKYINVLLPSFLAITLVLLFAIYFCPKSNVAELNTELFKGLLQFGVFGSIALFFKYYYEDRIIAAREKEKSNQEEEAEERKKKIRELELANEKQLKHFQIQKSTHDALINQRLSAFREFWQISKSIHNDQENQKDIIYKKQLAQKLEEWYFENSNGLFMSHKTMIYYRLLKKSLLTKESTSKQIGDEFSFLRTRLKVDAGIYTEKEANLPTFNSNEEE